MTFGPARMWPVRERSPLIRADPVAEAQIEKLLIKDIPVKKIQLLTAAAAFALSSAVFAGDPPEFEAADANGDGGVDATEWGAIEIDDKMSFGEADGNGDGKLDNDEYASAAGLDCA